ncbi:MAG: alkaline phosphatase family protein [Thermoplasmatota archaeon]
MISPDYNGGSIVNLMSSILKSLDFDPKYPPLNHLPSTSICDTKNIVLILIDGLGYNYLNEKGKETIFLDNLEGKMTSVFPSSTASAIPSILTGLSPQQHGITG